MKTFTKEEMGFLMTDAEWETFGKVMFDNCPIEGRQEAFSLYLQEKSKTFSYETFLRQIGTSMHMESVIEEFISQIAKEIKSEH